MYKGMELTFNQVQQALLCTSMLVASTIELLLHEPSKMYTSLKQNID